MPVDQMVSLSKSFWQQMGIPDYGQIFSDTGFDVFQQLVNVNKLFIELIDSTFENDFGLSANAFGFALIVYTVAIKTLIYPLYEGQLRSTARMRKVQPVMREIQRKYGNDQERMNAEMTRMYIEEKINPLQGFATAIVQLPIFVSLYKAIIQLSEQDEHFK